MLFACFHMAPATLQATNAVPTIWTMMSRDLGEPLGGKRAKGLTCDSENRSLMRRMMMMMMILESQASRIWSHKRDIGFRGPYLKCTTS